MTAIFSKAILLVPITHCESLIIKSKPANQNKIDRRIGQALKLTQSVVAAKSIASEKLAIIHEMITGF